MRWAYGITTVPERTELFARTRASLANAGFAEPTIFMDAEPKMGAFGRWVTALMELMVRKPHADRFALFQDDIIVRNDLCKYLEQCEMPAMGYWNLFTAMNNEPSGNWTGWHVARGNGIGAVALVFSKGGAVAALGNPLTFNHPLGTYAPKRCIDGVVHDAMALAGYKEYVHYPSLVQHTGDKSVCGNQPHPKAKTYSQESLCLS